MYIVVIIYYRGNYNIIRTRANNRTCAMTCSRGNYNNNNNNIVLQAFRRTLYYNIIFDVCVSRFNEERETKSLSSAETRCLSSKGVRGGREGTEGEGVNFSVYKARYLLQPTHNIICTSCSSCVHVEDDDDDVSSLFCRTNGKTRLLLPRVHAIGRISLLPRIQII